jgi:hypothetical protein
MVDEDSETQQAFCRVSNTLNLRYRPWLPLDVFKRTYGLRLCERADEMLNAGSQKIYTFSHFTMTQLKLVG